MQGRRERRGADRPKQNMYLVKKEKIKKKLPVFNASCSAGWMQEARALHWPECVSCRLGGRVDKRVGGRVGGWVGGREGRALLGNAEGTWAPGGSEWMTKFGLKGHANIHLLPAIKRVTQ